MDAWMAGTTGFTGVWVEMCHFTTAALKNDEFGVTHLSD